MAAKLEIQILKLLAIQQEINLAEIAQANGLSNESATDRRKIQRALAKLIEAEKIVPYGKARARFYKLKPYIISEPANEANYFQEIALTKESLELLHYLEKPLSSRKPVSYHKNFLTTYIPNKTFYLAENHREQLHQIGQVESVVRPAGTYSRSILNRLLIDLSWNSSRLEGNTYSLLETKRLIELGETAVGKDITETQMILNHKEAIEYIIETADEKKISSQAICSIHALLSENLLGNSSASGRIRTIAVNISGTTYIPLANPHLLQDYFDIFIKKLNLIKDPFEQSFFALVHLSYLQLFEDVNKRTARLVANIPLIKQNLKPFAFINIQQKDYLMTLLGIYEKNDTSLLQDLYLWAYQISGQSYSAIQQSLSEPNLFKLKYRTELKNIIHTVIIEKTPWNQLLVKIKTLIAQLNLTKDNSEKLFQIIETEIMNLHEGNVARFKIRPSEFKKWQEALHLR